MGEYEGTAQARDIQYDPRSLEISTWRYAYRGWIRGAFASERKNCWHQRHLGELDQRRVRPKGVAACFSDGLVLPAFFLGLRPIEFAQGLPLLGGAGLLVGFGTRLGSGCTSGQGVCGLANLSRRSLVATLCFVVAAAATVFLVRHGALNWHF
jgi:hypothetical protein